MKSARTYSKLSTAVSPGVCVKEEVKEAWLHGMHLKENGMGTKMDRAASSCCYCGLWCFVFNIIKTKCVHSEEENKKTLMCVKDSYTPSSRCSP